MYAAHFGTPRVRGDVWAGIVAHASAAPHVRRRMRVPDFFPRWGEPPRRRTGAEMAAAARDWATRAAAAAQTE